MTALSDWLPKIEEALASLSEKPQFHTPNPFPSKELENHLRTLFELPDLKIEAAAKGWVSPNHLLEGLGEKQLALQIVFTPLSAPLFFVTTEQDLKFLMAELLGGKEGCAPFFETSHMKGFYHYLALEVLGVCDRLHFAEDLAPRLQEEEVIPLVESFVYDISCRLPQSTFTGRLLLPLPFRNAWKGHFASKPVRPLTKEEREKIPVELSLEVGSGKLTLEEWKGVKTGDFVVLDRSSFDVTTGKGRVLLTLNGQPLFRGKIQSEGIKLLEYPIYEEGREQVSEEEQNGEEIDLYGDLVQESQEQAAEQPLPAERITPEKIPVVLTVEVGRLKMSAEELMQLAPGTVCDLKVHPEQGVDLVVNGKRVGKGELVKVGEVIGVRILKL